MTGLDAGADDFLTKPVDDFALFARVRSLVRLKMMTDELRMREETGQSMGLSDAAVTMIEPDPSGRILIVEDRPESVAWFRGGLEHKNKLVDVSNFDRRVCARGGDFDLIVAASASAISTASGFGSHLRSSPTSAQRADSGSGQRGRETEADPGASTGRERPI